MTRLYYDDSLIAAIMARDFGVDVKVGGIYGVSTLHLINEWTKGDGEIHPDSLSIFEPIVGDLVLEKGGALLVRRIDAEWYGYIYGNEQTIWCKPPIIQRDNKAFFTPLEEKSE